MVFEVIPFAVCTAGAGALGAGGWHIAMGNKSDSWSTCGGRGKAYSMKPERTTEEIAQALYATDGTKNENIGAERAHTGLSPRLSHVFETMAGTQNRNPKPPPLPPPKQTFKTPFKPEVDQKGKRVVSLAEGLRGAFRHENIGPPEGFFDRPQPETSYERHTGSVQRAETSYERHTRDRETSYERQQARPYTSPYAERRSQSPQRVPTTSVRTYSPDPGYRRVSPDGGRIERVVATAPDAPPQPSWIQRVEARDPRVEALSSSARPAVPQLSVSYYTPPAPKPLINPYPYQDEAAAPNASSCIFPASNPRPRFPDGAPGVSPTLDASSTFSSSAQTPSAPRLSDSRLLVQSPPRNVSTSSPLDLRPQTAPSPAPSSAGIGISLVPDQQGHMRVASMVPGGAAMRSGKLSVGDVVVSINNTEVQGKTVPEAIRLILGPHGTLVQLGVKSSLDSRAPRLVSIVRTASSYASAAKSPEAVSPTVPPPAFTPSVRQQPSGSFQGTRVL